MGTIQRFEDLEVWKLSRELAKKIYLLTKKLSVQHHSGIINQIRDASGSAMDNIAEGFEREGNKEFKQFLYIAKGSSGEARSQLYRLLDQELIGQTEFDEMLSELILLNRKLKKLINYLKDTDFPGQKFR